MLWRRGSASESFTLSKLDGPHQIRIMKEMEDSVIHSDDRHDSKTRHLWSERRTRGLLEGVVGLLPFLDSVEVKKPKSLRKGSVAGHVTECGH